MSEKYFDPIEVRDRVIDLTSKVQNQALRDMHQDLPPPEVLVTFEALEFARTLITQADFDEVIQKLHSEIATKRFRAVENSNLLSVDLRTISDINDCLRFFWPDQFNLYSLKALETVQAAMSYPVWSPAWRFQEELKPFVTFPAHLQALTEIYQGLEVGSWICVSGRWPGNFRNPLEGSMGQIAGFLEGFEGLFNLNHLSIYFKDPEDWIHNTYLFTIDLAIPKGQSAPSNSMLEIAGNNFVI